MSKAIGGQYALTASLVALSDSTLLNVDPATPIVLQLTLWASHAHAVTIQLNDASNPIVVPATTAYASPAIRCRAGDVSVEAATPDATDKAAIFAEFITGFEYNRQTQ